jgi:sugar transferase (PEP-CTERM system associated)
MRQFRILNHYINTSYLLLGLLEFGVLMAAARSALQLQYLRDPVQLDISLAGTLPAFVLFATVLTLMNLTMRVYPARYREGVTGMMLRTLVAYFLLGSVALGMLNRLNPGVLLPDSTLLYALPLALVYVTALRTVFFAVADDEKLARRVLVLGAGRRARLLLDKLGDQRHPGLIIVGFVPTGTDELCVPPERVIPGRGLLQITANEHDASEIVVCVDERRAGEGGNYPLSALLDCKLSGITVVDSVTFLERELEKIELELVNPSWLVFADGFRFSAARDIVKRAFDLCAALVLLLIAWPFMLATAFAVAAESGFTGPVLYRQVRVGYRGRLFQIAKFRSMRTDAEKDGKAVWAKAGDDRVTRVGRFIRATRLDELPQLWNVVRGEMSFVGPRPERPEFVQDLEKQIPFFAERHRVKPGLAGWAQLLYPYGASVEDAAQKLRYDLYYVKNHSLLLDLLILIQTVEVVLIGRGVR